MSGTERDPGIAKQQKAVRIKKAADDAAGLTVAERLTRASKEEIVKIPIKYSGGDFFIEMRLALVSEQQAIRRISKEFGGNVKDHEEEIEVKLAEMFAHHSIDESLDMDFWMRAEFSASIFQRLLYALLGMSEEQVRAAQEITEAKSFRKD